MKAENRKKKLFHILDTAYWLFRDGGFEQTSVEQIARAAGITKPTLYKYVKSKDEILLKFHELSHGDVEERVEEDLENGKAELALWRGISGIHSLVLDMGKEMFSHYIVHLLDTDDDSYRFHTGLEDLCIQAVIQLQESGVISNSAKARDLYHILVHLDQGLIMDWCRSEEDQNLHEQFRTLYESILDYHSSEEFDFPLCGIKRIADEDAYRIRRLVDQEGFAKNQVDLLP